MAVPAAMVPDSASAAAEARSSARRIARSGNAVGVVYADLDGFKPVNDVHGHHAGDKVLVATAARLASVVRGNDTVARLGGDEFVVVLDDLADEERIRTSCAGSRARSRSRSCSPTARRSSSAPALAAL